jgi:hypothetical protein
MRIRFNTHVYGPSLCARANQILDLPETEALVWINRGNASIVVENQMLEVPFQTATAPEQSRNKLRKKG